MLFYSWCSRCVGGLSLCFLLFLSFWVLSSEIESRHDSGESTSRGAGILTVLCAYYSLLIHILVLIFPLRACWAIWDVNCRLKMTVRSKKWRNLTLNHKRSSSQSSSEISAPIYASLSPSSPGEVELEYFADAEIDENRDIYAILIPSYREDVDVLRETLEVLACHPQARSQYDVYLAMEAREDSCDIKAIRLISEFVKKFRFIDFTIHPHGIKNEAPGKSSNIAWTARKASERYHANMRDNVIITVVDADSHLSSAYFHSITKMRVTHPTTASNTLYSAPIIFDRNAHLVPAIVRVADILWCAAGMSGLYAGSEIRPPTSVYSLPLGLADRVGGWDTGSGAIGEDLHMYLKCFFALNGNLTTRTVLAPVSQTNVSSGVNGYRGKFGDCHARYKQAIRHMWGSLDSGYALRQFVELWMERKTTRRTCKPMHMTGPYEKHYISEVDFEDLTKPECTRVGIFSDIMHYTVDPPNWIRIIYLFHRIFEAHFLPTHMAVLTIESITHSLLIRDTADRMDIAWTFEATGYLRVLGFFMIALYMILYEQFHSLCVKTRKAETKAAGLQMQFSCRSWVTNWVDYFLIPIVAPLFGSVPASQAQMCHFWTEDLEYTVSNKPLRIIAEEKGDV